MFGNKITKNHYLLLITRHFIGLSILFWKVNIIKNEIDNLESSEKKNPNHFLDIYNILVVPTDVSAIITQL